MYGCMNVNNREKSAGLVAILLNCHSITLYYECDFYSPKKYDILNGLEHNFHTTIEIQILTNISLSPICSQITEDHPKNGRTEKRTSTASKPHSDLVKWQGTPIRTPLLRLPPDLSPLALECFDCILRYCGDLPPDPELTEVKCVYTVLMVCVALIRHYDESRCSNQFVVVSFFSTATNILPFATKCTAN